MPIDILQDKGGKRRLKALIIKEFCQIFRDPSSFLICFVLPLILMFIYGYGVSLDLEHIRVGLVLQETTPKAQSFAYSIMNSRYFDVHLARDPRFFDEEIIRGKIRAIIVIPSYFSSFRQRPDHVAPIQVLTDGSEPNTATFAQNYLLGVWQNWLKQQSISDDLQGMPLVNLQHRFWYNEELQSRNFLIPGSLAIIMTLIGTLLTALVIAREWERGTMEALMATPVKISELMIGKLIPYFLMGMMSMAMCVAISVLLYQVPFRSSYLVLTAVSAVFLLSALSVGFLISTIARSQFVAAQAAMVAAFLPGFILSGFLFEISSMPYPIQLLTHFVSARYFVSSLQTLFLVGNIWSLLIPNTLAMLAIAVFFFSWAAHRIVKRLD
ncbi:MAG: ABC transporter permease [Parachlamydiaceae bacterium]